MSQAMRELGREAGLTRPETRAEVHWGMGSRPNPGVHATFAPPGRHLAGQRLSPVTIPGPLSGSRSLP